MWWFPVLVEESQSKKQIGLRLDLLHGTRCPGMLSSNTFSLSDLWAPRFITIRDLLCPTRPFYQNADTSTTDRHKFLSQSKARTLKYPVSISMWAANNTWTVINSILIWQWTMIFRTLQHKKKIPNDTEHVGDRQITSQAKISFCKVSECCLNILCKCNTYCTL